VSGATLRLPFAMLAVGVRGAAIVIVVVFGQSVL
jgi:hypothetical protein